MPVLGESEKARLQRIFEWSNSIPEPNRWRDSEQAAAAAAAEEAQLIRKRLLGQGALRKQKRWLDILANEVVERETVLKVMRAERQEHLSKGKLRHEIQERIQRMKEIQNSIARHERLEKQSQMAELVDPLSQSSCHATYNAQREKKNNNESTYQAGNPNPGGLSSHSKRLLEHNLNTSSCSSEKPVAAATNHRLYKHSHSTAPNSFPSFLSPKGSNCSSSKLVEQSKEEQPHPHHHEQENHHRYHQKENHHRHQVDKQRQERDLKTSRHHRTSCCRSESELKTKSRSRT